MGNSVTIKNETPYLFSYVVSYQAYWRTGQWHGTINPGDIVQTPRFEYVTYVFLKSSVFLKYGHHSADDLLRNYHILWPCFGFNNRTFIIRVCGHDQSKFQLSCEGYSEVLYCRNYGKEDEDRQKREREEEQRRNDQIKRERRIQEEIERDSKALQVNLGHTLEKLQVTSEQGFKAQQQSHILHDLVKNDAPSLQNTEMKDVEVKFSKLLEKCKIKEDEAKKSINISDRIRILQHRLVTEYAAKNKLDTFMQNMEKDFGYENQSLTENLNLLDAMINLTLIGSDPKQNTKKENQENYYISCIINKLYQDNKTLAVNLMNSIVPKFSKPSQEYLSQILFSEIWAPSNAYEFYCESCINAISQDKVETILQQVQTYHIGLKFAMCALKVGDPMSYLKCQIQKDKDVELILQEMRNFGYSDRILNVLEDVLPRVFDELALHEVLDENIKAECIRKIRNLNLGNPNLKHLEKILIDLSAAVKLTTTVPLSYTEKQSIGYFPRATQLASLLVLLLTPDCEGCLLEIATGEGKSCIVAMFALIQAIRGKTVDIITSSPVLARRDQEEWKKLYEMFDMTCSVAPYPKLDLTTDLQKREKFIQETYKSNIVYGTVDNFAADTLRQTFEKKNTRGDRKFDLAIVDEVDYMTLDSGVQITFLSHEATGMRHLDQLLTAIWAKVCMCQRIEDSETGEILWATGIQYFHKLATDAVGLGPTKNFSAIDIIKCGVTMGLLSEEDPQMTKEKKIDSSGSNYRDEGNQKLQNLISKCGPSQQKYLLTLFGKILNNLVNFKFYEMIDGKAVFLDSSSALEESDTICMLLLEQGQASLLMTEKDLIDSTVEEIKSKIKYSDNYRPSEVVGDQDESVILLPQYLREYTENRLCVFVENALRAILMEINREYTIDFGDLACSHESDCIIPIDFKSTGVLEKNKRWGNGLQQFIELKHQLAITPLSNVTNFMSNYHYFQQYVSQSGIYGVSGTLGDETDFSFLKKHYKTSCYVMPTHRYTKRVELPVLQVKGGRVSWITEICKCVAAKSCSKEWVKGQAVLVICEDVKTAEELQQKLKELETFPSADKITLYTRSDKHNVEMRTFDSGDVILATNLGGRGTDFRVTEQVNQSGGLAVILTHFPANRRVEKQVFGRTSRSGNPGMGQMILNHQDLPSAYQGQPLEIMRHLRANYEKEHIAEMENIELREVNNRHKLFAVFCEYLETFVGNYYPSLKVDIYNTGNIKALWSALSKSKMLDYQPALKALKETWALWLTLHEEEINNQENIEQLTKDLCKVLEMRSQSLLKGESDNFYDYVKVAMDRTFLHIQNKENDYGALDYWKKVESTDPLYRAISLYNCAFIKINLKTPGYMQEAIEHLEEAKKTMSIYVAEVSNTHIFGNITKIAKYEPHNKETNFTSQMETRMSLLQSWVSFIDRSMDKLKDLQKRQEDAVAKEKAVFSLSTNYGKVVSDEMSMLYDYGMSFVFEVEQEPKFCIDALVCFILGGLQFLAGGLICALTLGGASQFGMGLIAEGVSDMISGIHGMITGTFDWAQWAIAKAISIGISLATAGFSVLKKSGKAIFNITRDLLNGTQSFTSVAQNILQSGGKLLSSAATGVKSLIPCKETVAQSIKVLASNATKETMTKCAVTVGKELGKHAILYGIDKASKTALKAMLEIEMKPQIMSFVKENKDLERVLINFIVTRAVPEITLQAKNPGKYNILSSNEELLKETTRAACTIAVREVFSNQELVQSVISSLGLITEFIRIELKKTRRAVQVGVILIKCITQLTDIIKSLPTKSLINDKVIPTIIRNIADCYRFTEDNRSQFPDVIRVRKELQNTISQHLSNEFSVFLLDQIINGVSMVIKDKCVTEVTEKMEKTFPILNTKSTKLDFISCTQKPEPV